MLTKGQKSSVICTLTNLTLARRQLARMPSITGNRIAVLVAVVVSFIWSPASLWKLSIARRLKSHQLLWKKRSQLSQTPSTVAARFSC